MLRLARSIAALTACGLLCVPSAAAASAPPPTSSGSVVDRPSATAPPTRELTEDQNTAGYSVDTSVATGVYRADLVMPLVTCAEAVDGGLYPHLTVAGGADHTYARVFLLFSCFDGELAVDFVVDGSGGDYRPTLALTPGDPLRWIIRDNEGSATVVVHNRGTGQRQKFHLDAINPGWAAVGHGVPWPDAPAPSFEFGDFSAVRLGGTVPTSWSQLDVFGTDGTTLLLDTTSTGRRSFTVEAVLPPKPV